MVAVILLDVKITDPAVTYEKPREDSSWRNLRSICTNQLLLELVFYRIERSIYDRPDALYLSNLFAFDNKVSKEHNLR